MVDLPHPPCATVGANTADYVYDAFRRRVKKTFDGDSTVFVYDGWRCISEYDNGAAVTAPDRLFVFGTYLDEVLMMRNAAGTKYCYHTNHLYSVHAITNQSGAIVEAVGSYDAYGKPTIITGAGTDATWFTGDDVVGSVSAIGNPWFYTGQRLDAETGLMYYKNRYYSAELGRFISRDPFGYLGSEWNLFEYVNGLVTKSLDKLGLLPTPTEECWCWDLDVTQQDLDGKQLVDRSRFRDLARGDNIVKETQKFGSDLEKGTRRLKMRAARADDCDPCGGPATPEIQINVFFSWKAPKQPKDPTSEDVNQLQYPFNVTFAPEGAEYPPVGNTASAQKATPFVPPSNVPGQRYGRDVTVPLGFLRTDAPNSGDTVTIQLWVGGELCKEVRFTIK